MFTWFKKKEEKADVSLAYATKIQNWRPSMWVMTPDGIGIIFKLGVESEVHLTDDKGLTVSSKLYPIDALRQAKFTEIPASRRKVTKEIATDLGYF